MKKNVLVLIVMLMLMCFVRVGWADPSLTVTVTENEDGSVETVLVGNTEAMALMVEAYNTDREVTEGVSVNRVAIGNVVEAIKSTLVSQLVDTVYNEWRNTAEQDARAFRAAQEQVLEDSVTIN